MITKNIGNLIELSSKSGYIHKIGTNTYFQKGIIVDSPDLYEEVSEIPKYTREEYEQKVAELVKDRYSIEEEMGIQRKMITSLTSPTTLSDDLVESYSEEFIQYNSYVEECKIRAKEILNNETDGKEG